VSIALPPNNTGRAVVLVSIKLQARRQLGLECKNLRMNDITSPQFCLFMILSAEVDGCHRMCINSDTNIENSVVCLYRLKWGLMLLCEVLKNYSSVLVHQRAWEHAVCILNIKILALKNFQRRRLGLTISKTGYFGEVCSGGKWRRTCIN
jgi:hypothetical protein